MLGDDIDIIKTSKFKCLCRRNILVLLMALALYISNDLKSNESDVTILSILEYSFLIESLDSNTPKLNLLMYLF